MKKVCWTCLDALISYLRCVDSRAVAETGKVELRAVKVTEEMTSRAMSVVERILKRPRALGARDLTNCIQTTSYNT